MTREDAVKVCKALKTRYPGKFKDMNKDEMELFVSAIRNELDGMDADVAEWSIKRMDEKYMPDVDKLRNAMHFVYYDAAAILKKHEQALRDSTRWYEVLKDCDLDFFKRAINQLGGTAQ